MKKCILPITLLYLSATNSLFSSQQDKKSDKEASQTLLHQACEKCDFVFVPKITFKNLQAPKDDKGNSGVKTPDESTDPASTSSAKQTDWLPIIGVIACIGIVGIGLYHTLKKKQRTNPERSISN